MLTIRRKCAKCGRTIDVLTDKPSKLKGRLLICGGPRMTDGCWQGAQIVKRRNATVLAIMGRRIVEI